MDPETVPAAPEAAYPIASEEQAISLADTAAQFVDPVAVLWSFDFLMIVVVNFAIVVTFKQALKQAQKARWLNLAGVDIAITLCPLILGALFALAPGVLDQYAVATQVMIGMTAGFLNPVAIKVLSKIPGLQGMLVTAEDPSRKKGE